MDYKYKTKMVCSQEISFHIEGNVITAPDGTIFNFLRYATRKCLLLRVFPDEPERKPEYARLVDVPITASKFDILFDEKSNCYYMTYIL